MEYIMKELNEEKGRATVKNAEYKKNKTFEQLY